MTVDFSWPGKPTDNAFIESFNGKFQAECLNGHWLMSLDDAVRKCEAWRRDYNAATERPWDRYSRGFLPVASMGWSACSRSSDHRAGKFGHFPLQYRWLDLGALP